jgi:hypothetical protein
VHVNEVQAREVQAHRRTSMRYTLMRCMSMGCTPGEMHAKVHASEMHAHDQASLTYNAKATSHKYYDATRARS